VVCIGSLDAYEQRRWFAAGGQRTNTLAILVENGFAQAPAEGNN
jgi:hypothetical protein